jgi:hypothetical protein
VRGGKAETARADQPVAIGNEAVELAGEAMEPVGVPEIDDRFLVDEDLRDLIVEFLALGLVVGCSCGVQYPVISGTQGAVFGREGDLPGFILKANIA